GSANDPPRIVYHGSSGPGGGWITFAKYCTASLLGLLSSSTNSETLPIMLSAPNGLAPVSKLATSMGAPFACPTLARVASASFPHEYRRPSTPRAAFSHSCCVGRRLPAHFANAWASTIVISLIG